MGWSWPPTTSSGHYFQSQTWGILSGMGKRWITFRTFAINTIIRTTWLPHACFAHTRLPCEGIGSHSQHESCWVWLEYVGCTRPCLGAGMWMVSLCFWERNFSCTCVLSSVVVLTYSCAIHEIVNSEQCSGLNVMSHELWIFCWAFRKGLSVFQHFNVQPFRTFRILCQKTVTLFFHSIWS